MTSAVRIVVRGRVQGVFYRASTRNRALELGLSGWVRNLPDGRVEAWLEGTAEQIRRMTEWMAEGPERAVVEGVEQHEVSMQGHEGFEVKA